MQRQCGSSDASGSTSSTFRLADFCDPNCPIPRPIYWRGYTYVTNGKIAIRVPGKFANPGEHPALSASLHLWNHEWLTGWSSSLPTSTEDRWFAKEVIGPAELLNGVQFCDPDGGDYPARFRFREGQGLVWPCVRRRMNDEEG